MLLGESTPILQRQAVIATPPARLLCFACGGAAACAVLCIASALLGCSGKVLVENGAAGAQGTGGSGVTSGAAASIAATSAATATSSSSGTGGEGGAPPIPPLVEIDLGEVPVELPVEFDIPPGSLGFTVVAELTDPGAAYDLIGVKAILPPVGLPVVADYTIPAPMTLAIFQDYGIAAAAVPQSDAAPAMPLMPGTWKLVVGDEGMGAATAHVSVWRRQTVDGLFHGGKLDVNVFIADGATSPGYMSTALEAAFQGYIGLTLGNVTYQALGPEWSYIDEYTLYQALEQTKGAAGKPALNVIAVWQLGGALDGAAGVTAGAPALGLKHGTHISGLFFTPYEDPAIDTIILRHEMGHFAGLLHTSEFLAGYGDALSDTPFCDDASSKLESCPDYNNLMFPTGGNLVPVLTAEQIQVILASALYRGIVEEGGGPAQPLPLVADTGGDTARTSPGGSQAAVSATSSRAMGDPAQARWAVDLPPRAARFLAGHWCAGGVFSRPDFYGLLRSLGAGDPAVLVRVGLDRAAPVYVRKRALAAAGHDAPSGETLAVLVRVAEREDLPHAVRIGAMEGVAAASAGAKKTLAERIERAGSGVTARIAPRVLR